MQKKLPKIYQSTFSHTIDNNNRIFYSAYQQPIITENAVSSSKKEEPIRVKSIEEEVEELFHTTGYVFNIPVEITTNQRKIETKIAGKLNHTLITLDNEKIPISSIISIKRKDR